MNWWIAAAVFLLLFWPHMVLFRTQSLREEELTPISSHYRGINGQFSKYVMLYVLAIVLLLVAFLGLMAVSSHFVRQVGVGFGLLLISSYNVSQASFAIRYGVMPNSKFYGAGTTYWYSESGIVRRVAWAQIGMVVTLLVAVAVYTVAFQ